VLLLEDGFIAEYYLVGFTSRLRIITNGMLPTGQGGNSPAPCELARTMNARGGPPP
jgi:hypothetical protein